MEGTIAVMAHYYEKGNVQMHNVKDVKASNIAGDVSVLCPYPPLVAVCVGTDLQTCLSLCFLSMVLVDNQTRVDGNCWRDAVG